MKKILGLDLGTNSIGWSLIKQNFAKKEGEILGLGSRIIPMSKDIMDKFGRGQSHSQTAERTTARGIRRLNERNILRRERLHRVLNILGFLPKHYANAIYFNNKKGQFKPVENTEIKLNYTLDENGKHQFLFKESFNEMASLFKTKGIEKTPYDWVIYFLRKKALTKKISKEELAWLLLNFNQKRGYYQLRGEEEEVDSTKNENFYTLIVKEVIDSGDQNTKGTWYDVVLENGWVYRRQSKEPIFNWIGSEREFIITTHLEKDGSLKKDKEGEVKRSFRAVDSEKDWIAIKKKTEQDIDKSKKSIGTFIFDTLLEIPTQKINGKLIKTIERNYYKKELKAILEKQAEFHPQLQDLKLYRACLDELYPRNEAHQNNIKEKDFVYLFIEDIIFYQRPLKSKKSTIASCTYEFKKYVRDGEPQKEGLKCISKSNPLFQEFRLWQFMANLKIFQKEQIVNNKTTLDVNVTASFLSSEEDFEKLFDYLNNRKEVEQKNMLDHFIKEKKITKAQKNNYRWNYVEDRKYPCSETRSSFLSRLKKIGIQDEAAFLTKAIEQELWHIVYSVKDKNEFERALGTFARKKKIYESSFIENFKSYKPFSNDYGAYSEKAIKKLLPLMRRGKYWNEVDISTDVKIRVENIKERLESIEYDNEVFKNDNKLSSIVDDIIPKQLLKSFISFKDKNHFTGLNTYQACYAVYKRHSEVGEIIKWNSPAEIAWFLNPNNPDAFKQHSLRNPIVEQVVTETLRVVRDIWNYYGKGEKNFFNEIHIELGRDIKSPAKKREAISKRNTENEKTNQRIKAVLQELASDGIKDIKPYSPSQQEILKIYEEGVAQNPSVKYDVLSEDDVDKTRKEITPSKAQITKYKLWLEQGYISPYTGKTIPLSQLFTLNYQIEHIIPQSRYFDDSLSNKVICESGINQAKSNLLGYEFITKQGGSIIDDFPVLKLDEYENHCNHYFKNNRIKLKNLLAEEVPEGFINRQLNDSRYISKYVKGLLSNIVREEGERETTSRNIVPISGAITRKLKRDWGLNDKWNELVAPRFIRLNELTKSKKYGHWDKKINAFRCQVPEENEAERKVAKGFSKKRIDHRHHALDALVIACCTKDHTNYITSLNTSRNNHSLVSKLRHQEEKQIKDKITGIAKTIIVTKAYKHPWGNFTIDAKNSLENTIISFKKNLRVINKTNNKTWQWVEQSDGNYKKELVRQTKGNNWAIRKAMHKATISGLVNIKRKKKELSDVRNYLKDWELIIDKKTRKAVKKLWLDFDKEVVAIKKHLKKEPLKIDGVEINKIAVYEVVEAKSTRGIATILDEKFNRKKLDSVSDSGIKKIFENHIKNYIETKSEKLVERWDLAFNPTGLEEMNKNIVVLNNGKFHHPIYKVKTYEISERFAIGEKGNKSKKYAEAAKGTNLFFAIYWNEDKQNRVYETVPFNEVVAHQKWKASLSKEEQKTESFIPVKPEKGRFLFSLSPNDLIYVPSNEEMERPSEVDFDNLSKEQTKRIYVMVSTTQGKLQCRPLTYASFITETEAGSSNKSERILQFFDERIDVVDNKNNPVMIKTRCWKLEVDRLGNIITVTKR